MTTGAMVGFADEGLVVVGAAVVGESEVGEFDVGNEVIGDGVVGIAVVGALVADGAPVGAADVGGSEVRHTSSTAHSFSQDARASAHSRVTGDLVKNTLGEAVGSRVDGTSVGLLVGEELGVAVRVGDRVGGDTEGELVGAASQMVTVCWTAERQSACLYSASSSMSSSSYVVHTESTVHSASQATRASWQVVMGGAVVGDPVTEVVGRSDVGGSLGYTVEGDSVGAYVRFSLHMCSAADRPKPQNGSSEEMRPESYGG
ncbi:hypothetical protein CYMTET_36910 [Cymbomonas tetramitiformis]|uniref:Uncharacterized protein n=1 Tax=Cymbomonas tetramitiformis TaxID=36881 RepID=A0AAE0CGS4_9CHLO|nr:hypothetical protein CYMTET_36910 [Cymbomonas tetramitiformis]